MQPLIIICTHRNDGAKAETIATGLCPPTIPWRIVAERVGPWGAVEKRVHPWGNVEKRACPWEALGNARARYEPWRSAWALGNCGEVRGPAWSCQDAR